jgi:hypothetical protein
MSSKSSNYVILESSEEEKQPIYKPIIRNILSKHYNEINSASANTLYNLTTISKKRLKELIIKQNADAFNFLQSDRSSTIFKQYAHIPSITHLSSIPVGDICPETTEIEEGLKNAQSLDPLQSFISQTHWIYAHYIQQGESVMRLETQLYQKLDQLDKLHQKITVVLQLESNDALPAVIDSFSTYAENVFDESLIEDIYIELVQAYKKWNICRQIISLHTIVRSPVTEPQCSICLTEPISYASVPCGHTFCSTCSKKQGATCYICRGAVRERTKLYF